MRLKDLSCLFRPRREGPVVVIKGTAQNEPSSAWEHIASTQVTVVNLWLRQQHFQLTAHGTQFLIAKKLAGAQSCAVEDDRLRQTHNLFTTAEFLNYQL